VQEPDVAKSPADLDTLFAGRYSIVRGLAPGGMAEVHLAIDLRHDRQVVLKLLRPKWSESLASQRFLREISIAAKLSHPNIVPLYDSGELDGSLYYVMPYVEGSSLRARLASQRQLTLEEARQITIEVADALTYAHHRGIVHRDIKPDNILFESGHALVADFGIAKAIEAAAGDALTTGKVVVGTLAYMSPEQASAIENIDQRSDLYSLALVLYEMLTGEIPFGNSSPEGMFARKALGKYRPIRAVRKNIPGYVDRVVARALRPERTDRFESVAAFVSALSSAGEAERKRVARRRIATIACAGVVLLGGLTVVSRRTNGSIAPSTPELGRVVVAPLENRTGLASLDVVWPDGRRLDYRGSSEDRHSGSRAHAHSISGFEISCR
jgi:serine/threonine protein kinase